MDPVQVSQIAVRHFGELTNTPWEWFHIVSAREGTFRTEQHGDVSTQQLVHGVLCEFVSNGRRFSVLANGDGRVIRWNEIA